jgi:mono/diheme cytochrome c family protein
MIRVALSDEQIETLIRYFRALAEAQGLPEIPSTPSETEGARNDPAQRASEDRGKAAAGEALFLKNRCYDCHQLGNRRFAQIQGSWPLDQGRAEAPDLMFARRRIRREVAEAWIVKPKTLFPATKMPVFPLSKDDAAAIVEFIFSADPMILRTVHEEPQKTDVAAIPAYQEVEAILHDSCVHCHMPDRQGGAGNVGAYGYPARRLDLSTYAGIMRGSLQQDGSRADIVSPRDGKHPLLIERLLLRREENRRDFVRPFESILLEPWREENATPPLPPRNFRPGMPMGIPALTPRQIRIIEAWASGGAPGPPLIELDEKSRGPSGVGH